MNYPYLCVAFFFVFHITTDNQKNSVVGSGNRLPTVSTKPRVFYSKGLLAEDFIFALIGNDYCL